MSIRVHQLNKAFGTFHALKNIDLTIPTGSLVSLLGPSGCGKTTLLRIIAGLEFADSGQVFIHDQDVTHTPVQNRHIGFMFQHYALFRHMTVFDNIAFGLQVLPRSQRPTKEVMKETVHRLLKLVQLPHLEKAYPAQLSGGQQQRVALARALAVKPKVLLLDEPFGALDAKVRKELRQWLRDIHHELQITSLLVTHDQEEALEISDQIVLMNHGHVEQVGQGATLYHHPQTPFATEFLGEVARFSGTIEQGLWHYEQFKQAVPQELSHYTGNALGYVRPHEWLISREARGECALVQGQIYAIHDMGPLVRISVGQPHEPQDVELLMTQQQYAQQAYQQGERVYLYPQRMRFFADVAD